jgi:hypothetical protein
MYRFACLVCAVLALCAFSRGEAQAQTSGPTAPTAASSDAKIDELDRKIQVLTEELRALKEAQTLPEKREYKSAWGLGPAASKVYQVQRGLSIGGYGEFNLKEVVADSRGDDDTFDFVRLVLYTGYKFNDWILFNSEIEFEHASTGANGEVSVEFANLDFLFHESINARIGLVLVPVGFLNELHEPTFYHGNQRPEVERQIIPSTWRANGFGAFGEYGPLSYRTYVVSSFDATGFASNNIRGARQNGSEEIAEDFSWVGRLDFEPVPGALIGGSAYVGDSGQGQDYAGEDADVFTQLYEVHGEYKAQGLELRALGTLLDIDDADQVSLEVGETVAELSLGAYAEIAFDVLTVLAPDRGHYFAPWFRYSWIDTQNDVPSGFDKDKAFERHIYEVGFTYKPITQVVLKLDYRIQAAEEGSAPDEVRLGAGFIF